MSITTHVLLILFATLPVTGETLRDLCDIVHPETGAPVYCEPHSERAPIYDSPVCCDERSCFAAAEGGDCLTDEELFFCEYGEQSSSGEVRCYFEVPHFCAVFPCGEAQPGYTAHPQAEHICCEFGICVPYVAGYCEEQNVYGCGSLVSNPDGTVTCIDWE